MVGKVEEVLVVLDVELGTLVVLPMDVVVVLMMSHPSVVEEALVTDV